VVEHGDVQPSPLTIKGYEQCPAMGFDSHWAGTQDCAAMLARAREWLLAHNARKVKRHRKRSSFVVVVKDVVIDNYDDLRAAQRALASTHPAHSPHPRAIFEVRKRRYVVPNATTIAGYPQTRDYGFDAQCENDAEYTLMYNAVVKEMDKYFVVFGDTVEGPFSSFTPAIERMRSYPARSPTPRALFLARFGDLTHFDELAKELCDEDSVRAHQLVIDFIRNQRELQVKQL